MAGNTCSICALGRKSMQHFNLKNTPLLRTGLMALGFLALVLLVLGVSPAYAGCVAIYTDEYVRLLNTSGHTYNARNPLPANITTRPQCEAYLHSQSIWSTDYRFRQTRCECSGSSGGEGGGFYIPSRATPGQAMALGILGAFLNEALSPPDNSHQEQLIKQQEEQKRQAAEQAKKAALQNWLDFQAQDDLQKKMEQEARIKQGEKMLSTMQTVGGGGKLEPFSFGNPKLDLKPLSQKTYPTAKFDDWKKLLCSAYFSNLAKQSAKNVDARFYSDQAQRVMSGEPTYVECRIPQVSNEKLAKRMKEVKQVYDEMNVKMKDLQDIEYKISESKEKIEKAELKKEEATTKLNELQNRAATAKPEEKDEMEALTAAAKKELEDAVQESNQAKQSGSDYLAKQEQLKNELSQAQAKIQVGGE